MNELCTPALLYLFFSIIQIFIDIYLGLYNTAMIKLIVTIMITLLLNVLCEKNLGIISWIFVLVPLLFISVIVTILLYVFGMSVSIGKAKEKSYEPRDNVVQPEELIIERPYPKHGLSKYIHIPFFKNTDTISEQSIQSPSSSQSSPSPTPSSSSPSSSQNSSNIPPSPTPVLPTTKSSYNLPVPYGSSSPEYESFVSY
jgi:hypothetical protein